MLKLSPVIVRKKTHQNLGKNYIWRLHTKEFSPLCFGVFRGFFCEVLKSPTYNPVTNKCSIN